MSEKDKSLTSSSKREYYIHNFEESTTLQIPTLQKIGVRPRGQVFHDLGVKKPAAALKTELALPDYQSWVLSTILLGLHFNTANHGEVLGCLPLNWNK